MLWVTDRLLRYAGYRWSAYKGDIVGEESCKNYELIITVRLMLELIIGFLSSYLAGSIPSLKEVFSKKDNSSLEDRIQH